MGEESGGGEGPRRGGGRGPGERGSIGEGERQELKLFQSVAARFNFLAVDRPDVCTLRKS